MLRVFRELVGGGDSVSMVQCLIWTTGGASGFFVSWGVVVIV